MREIKIENADNREIKVHQKWNEYVKEMFHAIPMHKNMEGHKTLKSEVTSAVAKLNREKNQQNQMGL